MNNDNYSTAAHNSRQSYRSPAAKYFNIAVPAGKYEDLHLEFVFGDGRVYKLSTTPWRR